MGDVATKNLPAIAFCGLGAMGGGMARNLAKKGFPVTGYDIFTPLTESLVALGGKAAPSPAAASVGADFLIFMVVNAMQVDMALFDEETGAVPSLKQGATIIVTSTCPPAYLIELQSRLEHVRPDLRLLDCPVSGGSIRAGLGTLSIFSSGKDEDLDHADVVLKAMAEPLYRIPGGMSMGSVAKMCHQHQAAVNIIMASEIMALASAAGLNTRTVFEEVIASSGRTWMFENRLPHMLENDYDTVHSAVSIILKDVKIVTEHATSTGYPLLLANLAQQLYVKGGNMGWMKQDDAGLIRMYLPPSKHNLVGDLATGKVAPASTPLLTTKTIIDILRGLNLASTVECLKFAKHVGMDLTLLSDIVIRGAGSSAVFEEVAGSFAKSGTLDSRFLDPGRAVKGGLEAGLRAAGAMGQPMPIAAAALQQLYFEGLGS